METVLGGTPFAVSGIPLIPVEMVNICGILEAAWDCKLVVNGLKIWQCLLLPYAAWAFAKILTSVPPGQSRVPGVNKN